MRCDKEPAVFKILVRLRQHKESLLRPGIVPAMPGEIPQISFEMTVDDVMRQWPATIRTFLDFRMNCVGCPIAGFHTVRDACREHGVGLGDFLSALRTAASVVNSSTPRRALGDPEEAVRIADGDALPPAFHKALLFPSA